MEPTMKKKNSAHKMEDSDSMEWEVDQPDGVPSHSEGVRRNGNSSNSTEAVQRKDHTIEAAVLGIANITASDEVEDYWALVGQIPEPGHKRKIELEVEAEDEVEGRTPARKFTPLESDFAKTVVDEQCYYMDDQEEFRRVRDRVDSGFNEMHIQSPKSKPRYLPGDSRNSNPFRFKTACRRFGNDVANTGVSEFTGKSFDLRQNN